MTTLSEPQLAPPGAGLPMPELLLGRLLFGLWRRTGSLDTYTRLFQDERSRIRGLLGSCDAASGARRVLIARPRGLEDSSRYWSVWMTLDHLRIVNGAIARTVGTLVQGRVPEGQASTAAVKPDPAVDCSIAAAYEASCDDVIAAGALPALEAATPRFAHPWFGPLTAAGWYALAGRHLAIHRVQIERILAGLSGRKVA